MEIVTVDKLGRILVPKALRSRLGLRAGTQFLAANMDGKLVLQPLDTASLLRQWAEDLKDVDLDALSESVESEAEGDARRLYGDLLGGLQRTRGGPAAPATKHRRSRSSRKTGG